MRGLGHRSKRPTGAEAARMAAFGGLLSILVAACGEEPGPRKACEEAGGSWYEDPCDGKADACGEAICIVENAFGCHCDQDGQCWDGTSCVGAAPPPDGDGGDDGLGGDDGF